MAIMPLPILLTVDDDPEVSRSLARDLRQQYGEDYRIRRAESGSEALDALKELKLRDEKVGLLLADHRMPEMTGVEFLEQARQFYPKARRVLLTAYADTDAAIAAINQADVHYYLLKPWDPPQEKLYPVLDDLLEDWKMQDRLKSEERNRVVGHRWSAPSHEVKDFLTRNQVPFKWLELERDAEAATLLAASGGDVDHLPLVITDTGQTLHAPSTAEVAAAFGFLSTPALPFYDLIVIGGGPAGLGAAVYGASEGLRTVLVEREATGGQAGQSSRIENYLGFPGGITGGELAWRATTQARRFGAEMLLTSDVVEPGGVRVGPGRGAGQRQSAVGARRPPRHRRGLPAVGRPGPRRFHRERRLLRRHGDRGSVLRRRRRLHRRGRQFGRPGRGVLLPSGPPGHHHRAGSQPRAFDVPLLDRADPATARMSVCGRAARSSGASGSDHLERLRIADRESRYRGGGGSLVAVRLYRRRSLHRLAR